MKIQYHILLLAEQSEMQGHAWRKRRPTRYAYTSFSASLCHLKVDSSDIYYKYILFAVDQAEKGVLSVHAKFFG